MRENFDGNDEDIDVNIDETVVMISVSDKLLFNSGSYRVSNKANSLLERLAAVINSEPAIEVMIEGHTDDRGADDFNLDLSQRRAEAVKKFLVDQGISADRLIAKGFGSTRPILPNTSNRNRALNRRVEFNIVEQPKAKEEGAGDTK